MVAVLFLLDLFTGPRVNVPILYAFPLLAALLVRDRRLLWTAAILLVVCAFIPLLIHLHDIVPPKQQDIGNGYLPWWRIVNRSLAAVSVLIAALVLHVLIRVWVVAQRRRDEILEEHRRLEQSHEE